MKSISSGSAALKPSYPPTPILIRNGTSRFAPGKAVVFQKRLGSFMARVLIVDDDPVQLRLTAEVARRAGFTPETATGGDQALSLQRADSGFGAVLLDLVMPDRDGMAVMEAMQKDAIAVPVIIQTAHSSLDTVVSAMRTGAADFFV